MKNMYLFMVLLLSKTVFGQITFEHEYTEGLASRVKLEISGEKYAVLDPNNKKVNLYNPNHSLWKSINLPTLQGATLSNSFFVSETKINPDNSVEVVYSNYVSTGGAVVWESRVINENGSILLTVPDAISLVLSELPSLPSKLVATLVGGQNTGRVYSLPGLTLENTYAEGSVSRQLMGISGEKYVQQDTNNQWVKIYNANHSLWKTINLGAPSGSTVIGISHVSDTRINPDNLVEVMYSFNNGTSGNQGLITRIINENGGILLEAIGFSSGIVHELPGLSPKLILQNSYSPLASKVYSLPDLALEQTYSGGRVNRINLDISGEKFYFMDENTWQVKIHNANHTLWKTITVPISPSGPMGNVYHLSEAKFVPDSIVELVHSGMINSGPATSYLSKVVNENGDVLFSIPEAYLTALSELPSLPNKLISFKSTTAGFSSKIFGLPSMGPSLLPVHTELKAVQIFPNPSSDCLNIACDPTTFIDRVKLYSSDGKCVLDVPFNRNQTIDISTLPKGFYLVACQSANAFVSTTKVVVE